MNIVNKMEKSLSNKEVTELLVEVQAGNSQALDALIPHLYRELRGLARKVRRGRASETINTTALVHEAYIKLAASNALEMKSRLHFFRIAARAMRQVLVNEAEKRKAEKRGGGAEVTSFDEGLYDGPGMNDDDLLSLHELLGQLEIMNERQARIVEFRFFAGMNTVEIGEVLGVSERTVIRDWKVARAWLASQIRKPE